MTLNRFLALVCIFFAVAVQAQQPFNNKVRGIVTIQNTGKPLKGVLVSPDCGNPFSSTDSGFFEVECRGKAPGEEVSLSITPPSGYRVLNQNEVKSAVILKEAKTSVRVVVCKTKDWEKEALRYNGIMRDYDLNEKMDAQSARIEEIPDQIQQVVGQGNEELLKEIAEKLASFDRDQASDIVKEAFKAADARDINRAIDLMPDHLLEQEIAESAEKYRKSVENYMVKARFCVTAGRFDDAAANYRKAVTHDSLNAEHLAEYAKFLLHVEQPDAAIQYYEKCLQIKSVDPKDRLAATTGMSVGYMAKRDFEKAESVLLTGLEEARTLVLSDRPKYLNGLQDIYESLSLLYMIMRRCDQALLFKQQEIDVSAENTEEKDAAYYNSALMAKNILGVLYNATGNPAKANELCDESIAECRKLFASNDSAYASILAQVLENKVYMRYIDSLSAPEVEILLREAVTLRQTYTNRKTAIGDALAGLASYYNLIGNRQESVKYWMETIRLLTAEQKRTPFKVVERLQYAYSAMFQHYLHLENIDSCLYYSHKRLELVSGWAKTHPGIYDVDLGYALSQLSIVFLNNEQVDSAIIYINKAVPLRRQLLQEYSVARHLPGNHTLLIEENELYFKLNDNFCNKLDSADLLDNRLEDLGFSYSALGLAWFKKNDTWHRDSFYRLATDIFEDLVRRNPDVYEYHYGVMLLDWVKAYSILDPKNPLTLELGERVLAIAKKQTSDDLTLLIDASTPLSSLYFDKGRIMEVIDLATLKIAMINKSETINSKEMQAALAGAFQLRSAMNMK
ncbi:MAG: hypothetical protein KA165_19450, partial [Saprospiraceae bacterium]|nr:hypothetical protein [Saprospiraceae bacterium]